MNLVIGRRVGWPKSVEVLLPCISSFGSNKLSIKFSTRLKMCALTRLWILQSWHPNKAETKDVFVFPLSLRYH